MKAKGVLRYASLSLAVLMGCPLPVAGPSYESSLSWGRDAARSSALAPGTRGAQDLSGTYANIESGAPAQLLFVADDVILPAPAPRFVDRFIPKNSVHGSGTLVMNPAGRELFERSRVAQEQICELVFSTGVKATKYTRADWWWNAFDLGNGVSMIRLFGAYSPEVLKNLVLPACTEPFFIDSQMTALVGRAKKPITSRGAVLFVKQGRVSLEEYLKSLNSSEEKKLFYRRLLVAIKDVLETSAGYYLGINWKDFEVDPQTGRIYFAALKKVIDIHAGVFVSQKSNWNIFGSYVGSYKDEYERRIFLRSKRLEILVLLKEQHVQYENIPEGGDTTTEEVITGYHQESTGREIMDMDAYYNTFYTTEMVDVPEYSTVTIVGPKDQDRKNYINGLWGERERLLGKFSDFWRRMSFSFEDSDADNLARIDKIIESDKRSNYSDAILNGAPDNEEFLVALLNILDPYYPGQMLSLSA